MSKQQTMFGEQAVPKGKAMADWCQIIYAAYPRKQAAGHAKQMIARVIKKRLIAPADLLEAVEVYARWCAAAKKEREYIPHCGSWINGRRWEDELEPVAKTRQHYPKICPKCNYPEWWLHDYPHEAKGGRCHDCGYRTGASHA